MAFIARFSSAPIYSERLDNGTLRSSENLPSGWSLWSSDGRILPSPGVYRVDGWGNGPVQIRRTDGTFQTIPTPTAIRISEGEAVLLPGAGYVGGVAVQRID